MGRIMSRVAVSRCGPAIERENAWLRRLLQWCRPRLKQPFYAGQLDRALAAGPTDAPTDEPNPPPSDAAPVRPLDVVPEYPKQSYMSGFFDAAAVREGDGERARELINRLDWLCSAIGDDERDSLINHIAAALRSAREERAAAPVREGNGERAREPCDDADIMRLWRQCGLPEWFLGNGGTNHKLAAFAAALRSAREECDVLQAIVQRQEGEEMDRRIELVRVREERDAAVAELQRLHAAAKAFEEDLSEYCDGPERDALRAALAAAPPAQDEGRER